MRSRTRIVIKRALVEMEDVFELADFALAHEYAHESTATTTESE